MSIVLRFGEALARYGSGVASFAFAEEFRRGPRIDISDVLAWVDDLGEELPLDMFSHLQMPSPSMVVFMRRRDGVRVAVDLRPDGVNGLRGQAWFLDRDGNLAFGGGEAAVQVSEHRTPEGAGLVAPGSLMATSHEHVREHFAAFLTVQILNCRNVRLVERQPSRQERRRLEREGRAGQMATWHTIDIEPFRRVMRDEGHVETEGFARALHKCRAHFADYTKGNGLFGKHKGIFLISEHWRGDASQGVVRGDYRLRPPQGDEKYKAPEIVSQETA